MPFRYFVALFATLMIFLIASAPAWLMASLVSSLSTNTIRLEKPEGSFWKGRAEFVSYRLPDASRQQLKNFSWDVLFLRLLRGEAATHLVLADSQANGDGIFSLSVSGLLIDELRAVFPAELLPPAIPILAIWNPSGVVRINSGKVRLNPIETLETATIQWANASLAMINIPRLGDYELKIAPDQNKINLGLTTTNGVLVLTGSGQYAQGSGGEFHGTASAAQGYVQQLAPLLQVMGQPNGDGSVSLSLRFPALQ